ncbi:protein dhs-3-like [Lineus longissimus]|uniref:protein dhs-3-like n=1 Tax=Lineus longissimus TaxID=88925 RepID=UPI002B4F8622
MAVLWRIFREIFSTFWQFSYHLVVAIFNTFVPARFRQKDVAGEIVLITGAGSGIGRLMALRFAALGCSVVLWDINNSNNEETANQIREQGGQTTTYTCDVSDRRQINETVEKVKRHVGDVDILINNAGVVSGKLLTECSDDDIIKTMEVNIMSHFWTVKSFLPSMVERNRGHIVTISSATAFVASSHLVDYCTSKSAAFGFNNALKEELRILGKDGVHTTCVCPSVINTGMFDGFKIRYPWIIPYLEPEYTADKVVEAVRTNQQILILPRIVYGVPFLSWILPGKCLTVLLQMLGSDECMENFKGREKKNI